MEVEKNIPKIPAEPLAKTKIKEKSGTYISTGLGTAILLAAFAVAALLLMAGKSNFQAIGSIIQPTIKSGYKIGWWKPGYDSRCMPGNKKGFSRCYYK